MKIIIWTQSPPKIAAIEEATKKCIYFVGENIEIIPLKVSSEISDMPLSIEENMTGAKNRAFNAKKEISDWDFYIGMEGGTTRIWEKAYLFGVVYILDKNGNWHFGFSNLMEVPQYFDKKLYTHKEDLWIILEKVTGVENASKKNWAFWAWSDDMLTRKEQFLLAFLSAIPAFYNKYYTL